MPTSSISNYFQGVAFKRLAAVEADPEISNQHELDGVNGLRQLFGAQKLTDLPTRFLYLYDDAADPMVADGLTTWYDSRQNQSHRSAEFRLYFKDNPVMEKANAGDLCIVAKTSENSIIVIVCDENSTWELQAIHLFEIDAASESLSVKDFSRPNDVELGIAERGLLDALGIEVIDKDESRLDEMLTRFGKQFPTSNLFSTYARSVSEQVQADREPDSVLMYWMEREEFLFRALEHHLVSERLAAGFEGVEDFIQYSLSVQNRRKARAGLALENHVEEILRVSNIKYIRDKATELRSRPDFIFPSLGDYLDDSFPAERRTMLAVKSTCKDRWRQVLSEARKIPLKHLLTLEPSISEFQTDEMKESSVQLVVPKGTHSTYTAAQSVWLLSVEDLLALLKSRQAA